MTHTRLVLLGFVIYFLPFYGFSRSPFRLKPEGVPSVSLCWQDDPSRSYSLTDWHLQKYPLFAFHIDDLQQDILPDTAIPLYSNASVEGSTLKSLIIEVIIELQKKKKKAKRKKSLNISLFYKIKTLAIKDNVD